MTNPNIDDPTKRPSADFDTLDVALAARNAVVREAGFKVRQSRIIPPPLRRLTAAELLNSLAQDVPGLSLTSRKEVIDTVLQAVKVTEKRTDRLSAPTRHAIGNFAQSIFDSMNDSNIRAQRRIITS